MPKRIKSLNIEQILHKLDLSCSSESEQELPGSDLETDCQSDSELRRQAEEEASASCISDTDDDEVTVYRINHGMPSLQTYIQPRATPAETQANIGVYYVIFSFLVVNYIISYNIHLLYMCFSFHEHIDPVFDTIVISSVSKRIHLHYSSG